jgi:hypothetical protein
MIIDENEFLQHFGVKGMKWGVRRNQPKKPVRRSADAKKAKTILERRERSGTSSLSNNDIQIAIRRLQLEQQLGQLTTAPPRQSAIRRGHRTITEALNMGQTVNRAMTFARSPAGRAMAAAFAAAGAAAGASRMSGQSSTIRLPNLQLNP